MLLYYKSNQEVLGKSDREEQPGRATVKSDREERQGRATGKSDREEWSRKGDWEEWTGKSDWEAGKAHLCPVVKEYTLRCG